jgi:(2R)-sulfolactate sulfo-lyase subunit alpha
LALVDLAAGQDIVEYGQRVGIATADISKGEYVHVHNVRSARWNNSVA